MGLLLCGMSASRHSLSPSQWPLFHHHSSAAATMITKKMLRPDIRATISARCNAEPASSRLCPPCAAFEWPMEVVAHYAATPRSLCVVDRPLSCGWYFTKGEIRVYSEEHSMGAAVVFPYRLVVRPRIIQVSGRVGGLNSLDGYGSCCLEPWLWLKYLLPICSGNRNLLETYRPLEGDNALIEFGVHHARHICCTLQNIAWTMGVWTQWASSSWSTTADVECEEQFC